EGVVPRGGRAEEGAADADVEVAVEVAGLAVAVAVGRVRVLDRGQASAGAADGAHGAAAGLLRERVRVRADGAGETVRVDGLVRAGADAVRVDDGDVGHRDGEERAEEDRSLVHGNASVFASHRALPPDRGRAPMREVCTRFVEELCEAPPVQEGGCTEREARKIVKRREKKAGQSPRGTCSGDDVVQAGGRGV